jgi:hypothetical protein
MFCPEALVPHQGGMGQGPCGGQRRRTAMAISRMMMSPMPKNRGIRHPFGFDFLWGVDGFGADIFLLKLKNWWDVMLNEIIYKLITYYNNVILIMLICSELRIDRIPPRKLFKIEESLCATWNG